MKLQPFLWQVAALSLPLATGVLGVLEGPGDLHDAHTAGQRLAASAAVAYGVLGLASALALIAWRPGARWLLYAWAVPVTIAGGLAPVVWGGASTFTGVVSGLICGELAFLWILLGRKVLKSAQPTEVGSGTVVE